MCLAVPGELLSISEGEPLCRTARVRFGGVIIGHRLCWGCRQLPGGIDSQERARKTSSEGEG